MGLDLLLPNGHGGCQAVAVRLADQGFARHLLDLRGDFEDVAPQRGGRCLLFFERLEVYLEAGVGGGSLDRRIADSQAGHDHQDDQDAHDVGYDVQEGIVTRRLRRVSGGSSHGAVGSR